jgi:hypothetical protein
MRHPSGEQGFTLVELLIGMVLTVVVFGATLTVLDAFSHQYQSGQRRLSAQDYARLGVDRIVRQLRNVSSPVTTPKLLERATPWDIVFQTVGTRNGSNLTGTERVRYCVPPDPSPGSSSNEVLIGETQAWSTQAAPANPWSSDPGVTLPCPDSTLPSGVTKTVVANAITNAYLSSGTPSPSRAAFCFNNSCAPQAVGDLGNIFTVQINLFVNSTPTFGNAETEIQSSAFLRNQPRAPLANFTPTYTGGGGVLLNGGGSYSPDGADLSYSWACTLGCSTDQAASLASQQTGLVDWQPGPGTYTVTLTVTDQTGLTAPFDKQVIVT